MSRSGATFHVPPRDRVDASKQVNLLFTAEVIGMVNDCIDAEGRNASAIVRDAVEEYWRKRHPKDVAA